MACFGVQLVSYATMARLMALVVVAAAAVLVAVASLSAAASNDSAVVETLCEPFEERLTQAGSAQRDCHRILVWRCLQEGSYRDDCGGLGDRWVGVDRA